MPPLLDNARKESPGRKRIIAVSAAGVFVVIIFIVWITTLPGRFAETSEPEQATKEQDPGFFESTKRKATLLFEGIEFPEFGDPIEYSRDNGEEKEAVSEEAKVGTSTEEVSFDDLVGDFLQEETATSSGE